MRLGRTAAAGYGDLISRLWVCGSRRGSVLTLLCPQVRLIGCDWVALTMRFGDARGAKCKAGQVFGRAAAYLVGDQRGKPLQSVSVAECWYLCLRLRPAHPKFEFVINLQIAKTLRLTLAPGIDLDR